MAKKYPARPPFPSLDDLIGSIDIIVQTLQANRYFFRPANGGPGQAYDEMEQLNLVRKVIGDALRSRPTFADYPLEIFNDITNAAGDANCSIKWAKDQLYALATTKSSGRYPHKDRLIDFLRKLRLCVKETERYRSG
jgi:hypothetical protein